MSEHFSFIGPDDKPALLAVQTEAVRNKCQSKLEEAGYKVHVVLEHDQFLEQFSQIQYLITVVEDCFGGMTQLENKSLMELQRMPMNLRRHTFAVLIGPEYESYNSKQAYAQSVHVVLNPQDIDQYFNRAITISVQENDLILKMYRDVLNEVAHGK